MYSPPLADKALEVKLTSHWSTFINLTFFIHSGIKPYNCTLCTYKSNRKDLLGKHMRKHTGKGTLNSYWLINRPKVVNAFFITLTSHVTRALHVF